MDAAEDLLEVAQRFVQLCGKAERPVLTFATLMGFDDLYTEAKRLVDMVDPHEEDETHVGT
jgi:hypothetical protein